MILKGVYKELSDTVYLTLHTTGDTIHLVCVDQNGSIVPEGRLLSIICDNEGVGTVVLAPYLNQNLPFNMEDHSEGGKKVLVKDTYI